MMRIFPPRYRTTAGLKVLRHASALLAACLLAACVSTPLAPPDTQPPEVTARPAPPSPQTTDPTPRKRGAYYKDDGPDANPPPNLDAVPDAQPRPEPLHRFANAPYSVFGQDYVPDTQVKPYKARGVASWYGRKFHGQRTASGEIYDMYTMTAAHRTLPIPSYARVLNRRNGKAVVVRINDRGPFHGNRIMDLSYTAAHKLGFVSQGSTEIDVETILPEGVELVNAKIPPVALRTRTTAKPVTPPAPSADPLMALASADSLSTLPTTAPPTPDPVAITSTRYPETKPPGIFLQLGAFGTASNAEGFRTLVAHDLAWLADKLSVLRLGDRFRLHAGPFSSEAEARGVASRIASALRLKPFIAR